MDTIDSMVGPAIAVSEESGAPEVSVTISGDATAIPLFVDVDGTLTRADLSLENLVRVARQSIRSFLLVLLMLIRGRAAAKTLAARRSPADPATLPYRPEVLELIAQARREGRKVILASASHWRNVRRVARHLDLDEDVIATSNRCNAKGKTKLAVIRQRIGANGSFDYIGDSRADRPVWDAARDAMTVGYRPGGGKVRAVAPSAASALRTIIKAMRLQQWAKNGLVFVPLITSGLAFSPEHILLSLVAALSMSLAASAIYLLNDILDIDVDRAHATKHARPLASGALSIPAGIAVSILLGVISLASAWFAGSAALVGWLLVYVALSVAYSVRLKAVMVGDAIVLASLFTLRIVVGGAALGVVLSYWLLLFSVFLFLSLAYLKRYIEIRGQADPRPMVKGRGYTGGDQDLVMAWGVASGMVAVLVMALFAHAPEAIANYSAPDVLMLICLPLIYWLNRIWMMARRGEVDMDPVAFAVRDGRSIAIGVCVAGIFLLAQFGPEQLIGSVPGMFG